MGHVKLGQSPPSDLANATVLDSDGASVPLASFWGSGPTLIIFLRHFGCLGCSAHVNEIAPRFPELNQLGIRTVFVGNGRPHFIEGFIERHGLGDKQVDIVTDPSLKVFAAAGFKRSILSTLGPRAAISAARALAAGHRQTSIQGDGLQQGGTLILNQQGEVVFYHASKYVGDHAAAVEVIDTAMRVAVAAAKHQI